jgi:hypothetical protein
MKGNTAGGVTGERCSPLQKKPYPLFFYSRRDKPSIS